jgi:alkylation response protein AidB-like acyl-CoA dehydrogenase
MDFSLNEEQQAIRDLARQILEGVVTHERLKELEAGEERFDRKAWEELAKANLLGIALPEDVGGSGLGFVEVALVLEEVGRTVAMVPVLPTIVMGALPIAEFGTEQQKGELLPPVVAGGLVLTAALDTSLGAVTATKDGDGWRLDGTVTCVPAGMLADRILVPAGDTVFVVDPAAPGVSRERQETTSGLVEARLTLEGVHLTARDRLGAEGQGPAIVEWITERADAAIAATMIGVCDVAVRLTAEYTKTREQFDRPIATFQAVGQRAAEAYIDTEAVRLTALQAVWRLANGLPAAKEVAVAKFWASEGGQRVAYACQHLHGGIGVDRDYPLFRYFLAARTIDLTLGGATSQLIRLGEILAERPVA